jgi:hypothetical protein
MRLHLLMPAPAQPFGRRNLSRLPQSRPLKASALPPFAATLATSAETETSAAVSKFAASLAEERRKMDENKILQGPRIVPRSRRAALLAGLVAACLHVSLDLGSSIALSQRLGSVSIAGQAVPVGPMLLLDSLLSAARASAFCLLAVRAILSRLETTHIGAYTSCGCLVALLYTTIMQAIGYGQLERLPLDMATGCTAGFFYRLFAGTKPA